MAEEKKSTVDAGAFIAWARNEAIPLSIPRHDDNYDDLEFLGDVVGDARIVAIGENAHYLHEWNRRPRSGVQIPCRKARIQYFRAGVGAR